MFKKVKSWEMKLLHDISTNSPIMYLSHLKKVVSYVESHRFFFGIFNILSAQNKKFPEFFQKLVPLLEFVSQNDATMLYINGIAQLIGFGSSPEPELAVYFFDKASKLNHSISINSLGYCFHTGSGVERNVQKAFNLYEKSAALGNPTAYYNMSRCYADGDGIEKDSEHAFRLLKKSVKMGDFREANLVGVCYETGDGIEKNINKAIKYYHNGVKWGNVYSILNLGRCYEIGLGVDVDFLKSYRYFRKASKKKNSYAYYKLFQFFSVGQGVKRNLKKAYRSLKIMSELESKDVRLLEYGLYCLFSEKNDQAAVDSFRKSNDYLSHFWYGYCIYNGIGLQSKIADGIDLMKDSENSFHISAIFLSSYAPLKLSVQ